MNKKSLQMTQRESLVLALTKYHGFTVDAVSSTTRWVVLRHQTRNTMYFVGLRGALRTGSSPAASTQLGSMVKTRLLREGGYWDHLRPVSDKNPGRRWSSRGVPFLGPSGA